ncbi:DUF1345 domain-containing protein [Nocardiopsis changdeensis]|uniref:DUF1345 domain-containing protein n=1 Tax=Nocardiopsis changdeensis TaxID=2831969 RepID=A0ABX8BDZ3_9ACTN|nr:MULTISPECIES: DUF1345 domain-containing protein [Nocardiopsis]QUX20460.1 DUF1345 domain-containing protein [Nocardiopsis changdeensis]QYX36390.1 DUF1345 domain-containing protein [Nocardiopsis sp. MT53]
MTTTAARTGFAGLALTRLAELFILLLGLFLIFGGDPEEDLGFLFLWDAAVLLYLAVGIWSVRRRALGAPGAAGGVPRPRRRWERVLRPKRFILVFPVLAGFAGLSAALLVLDFSGDDVLGTAIAAFGALTMVLGWILLHSGYARSYRARNEDERGLEFPCTEHPTMPDYLYFSFVMGSTFAVSDVAVVSTRMRWHVMLHGILAFFYNAVVLATAIGVVTGG